MKNKINIYQADIHSYKIPTNQLLAKTMRLFLGPVARLRGLGMNMLVFSSLRYFCLCGVQLMFSIPGICRCEVLRKCSSSSLRNSSISATCSQGEMLSQASPFPSITTLKLLQLVHFQTDKKTKPETKIHKGSARTAGDSPTMSLFLFPPFLFGFNSFIAVEQSSRCTPCIVAGPNICPLHFKLK